VVVPGRIESCYCAARRRSGSNGRLLLLLLPLLVLSRRHLSSGEEGRRKAIAIHVHLRRVKLVIRWLLLPLPRPRLDSSQEPVRSPQVERVEREASGGGGPPAAAPKDRGHALRSLGGGGGSEGREGRCRWCWWRRRREAVRFPATAFPLPSLSCAAAYWLAGTVRKGAAGEGARHALLAKLSPAFGRGVIHHGGPEAFEIVRRCEPVGICSTTLLRFV
jgi:hypothetical protein